MEDKIISGGNEICFDRHSTLVDVIEQIDPFFDYHLVVINSTTVDRIDKLTIDRNTLKLKEKHKDKNQWIFLGNDGTEYTVFSVESSDFLANPGLSDLVLAREIIDDSDSSTENSVDSSSSGTHSDDCPEKAKKLLKLEGEKKEGKKEKEENSSGSSSESSGKNLDILSEGWTETGSSSEIYRKSNVSPPETIETDESLVFKLNTGSTTILP